MPVSEANTKNIFAVRQIPITDTIARIYERYVNDFRPRKSPHNYLFLSQECAPLSKRAVNEVLRVVSSHLSRGSAQALREVMHKAAITPMIFDIPAPAFDLNNSSTQVMIWRWQCRNCAPSLGGHATLKCQDSMPERTLNISFLRRGTIRSMCMWTQCEP